MAVSERDLALDKRLSELCGLMPLLSMVTPTNVAEARKRFLQDDLDPNFEYRQLPDLDALEHELSSLRSEDADDPAIATVAQGLINELGLRLEMFRKRDTEAFFLTSVEMFGHVDETTHQLALDLLDSLEETRNDGEYLGAEEFARTARVELDYYRKLFPELPSRVVVSPDIAGVLVETGDLYVSESTKIARDRVDQLIQHEVGTHLVTFLNGLAQPLQMLSLGLAGYDELQEALGVFAEHLSGDVPPSRLRTLALRVIAARARSEGAEFKECFDILVGHGSSANAAFSTTMRAYRSGGMTKDAIYLRGLTRLLDHLATGADIEALFVGKISFETLPLVEELRERKVLVDPPLRPRFLDMDGAREKLEEISAGAGIDTIGRIAA